MKQLTLEELNKQFEHDTDILAKVLNQLTRSDVIGLVLFRNEQMDSSYYDDVASIIFGENCTYKSLKDVEGKHLYDLPSQRQYPFAFYIK